MSNAINKSIAFQLNQHFSRVDRNGDGISKRELYLTMTDRSQPVELRMACKAALEDDTFEMLRAGERPFSPGPVTIRWSDEWRDDLEGPGDGRNPGNLRDVANISSGGVRGVLRGGGDAPANPAGLALVAQIANSNPRIFDNEGWDGQVSQRELGNVLTSNRPQDIRLAAQGLMDVSESLDTAGNANGVLDRVDLRVAASMIPGDVTVRPGEVMRAGYAKKSADGQFTVQFQDDGNLVVYKNDDNGNANGADPRWSTGTHGRAQGGYAKLTESGVLKVFTPSHEEVWSSDRDARTPENQRKPWKSEPGAFLILQGGTGNLIMYSRFGEALGDANGWANPGR